MEYKKIAVMIYPHFSMQEISTLTDALAIWYNREVEVFASSKEIINTEDGFQVIAHKTFDEFELSNYDCLILPGIINPLPALFDEDNIRFLKQFKDKDFLIASISSSPILLAKAGLLDNKEFTLGLWQEINEWADFIPDSNILHKPIHRDQNIITAIGFAFKEFAVETIKGLGLDCSIDMFDGVIREYTVDELTFYMGEENFEKFKGDYEMKGKKLN